MSKQLCLRNPFLECLTADTSHRARSAKCLLDILNDFLPSAYRPMFQNLLSGLYRCLSPNDDRQRTEVLKDLSVS
jgi:hypothetical protein